MNLNESRIKLAKGQLTAKTNLTNTEDDLLRELLVATNEDYNFIKNNYSAYETCLLLESKQNSIGNKGKTFMTTYKQGDILMVDLGINVYGHEFSYEHPCVVMINEKSKVFVIPCTSQPARRDKKGNVYKEYVEGLQSDGFVKKTTLLVTEAKFIDKTRVKAKLGEISKTKFIELEDKLFSILLPYKKYALEKVRKDVVTLEAEKNILSSEKENIQKELYKLRSRLSLISNIIDKDNATKELEDIKKILDDCV